MGVPWGISESAYNARDYRPYAINIRRFGVPGLGLKRGLSEDLVIAPYATALAAMVDPIAASQNIERLAEAGGKGGTVSTNRSITRPRVFRRAKKVAVVRAYFAHHQGMTMVAFANVLTAGVHAAPGSTPNRL